jgi:hypothetical protein
MKEEKAMTEQMPEAKLTPYEEWERDYDRRREAERTPDPEVVAENQREAAQVAEDLARAESERPARIEALLQRIADALDPAGRAR